jgi:hypothetical protein
MADIRFLLTDKEIARLPTPSKGWHVARDTELKGFYVVVGKRKRTFTVQGDLLEDGKPETSIRVAIGDVKELSTRTNSDGVRSVNSRFSSRAAPASDMPGDENPDLSFHPRAQPETAAW